MLAGHSHCGQVRFPLVPVFWLPGGAARFLIGRFADPDSGPYVRLGTGISHLPLGFRCPPELFIIAVHPRLLR
jgi:uncharacterized protein